MQYYFVTNVHDVNDKIHYNLLLGSFTNSFGRLIVLHNRQRKKILSRMKTNWKHLSNVVPSRYFMDQHHKISSRYTDLQHCIIIQRIIVHNTRCNNIIFVILFSNSISLPTTSTKRWSLKNLSLMYFGNWLNISTLVALHFSREHF